MASTVLQEDDAWALATAWQDELQGRVKLIKASDTFRLIKSYEWIEIDFSGDSALGIEPVHRPLRLAVAARAATIAWAALSRCPGYGIHENPMFWKRVLGEVSQWKRPLPTMPQPMDQIKPPSFKSVKDSSRLFASSDAVFPRVRLNLVGMPSGSARDVVRVFYGVESSHSDGTMADSNKMPRDALQRLDKAYGGFQHLIRKDPISKVRRMLHKLQQAHTRFPQQLSVIRIPVRVYGMPTSKLSELRLFTSKTPRRKDQNLPIFELDDMPVRSRAFYPQEPPSRWTFADQRKALAGQLINNLGVGSAEPPLSFTNVQLYPSSLRETTIEALFASLPFSTAVDTVAFNFKDFMAFSRPYHNLPASTWKWLGYAMFHPRAAQSSRQKQDFQVAADEACVDVFTTMAQGNNLIDCTDESGARILCTGYYSATVGETTPLHVAADASSAVITEVLAGVIVDVCGITSPDEIHQIHRRVLVAVVLPGFGLGWIRATAVKHVEYHPPNPTPVLSHLKASKEQIYFDRVFPLVCANLVSLRTCFVAGNDQLERILRLSPHLKSLGICHDGSFWKDSSPMVLSEMPRLKSLQLYDGSDPTTCFEPSAFAIATALSELEELRVSEFVESTRETTLSFLRGHHRLQYVHWCSKYGQGFSSKSGVESGRRAHKKLFGAGEVDLAVVTGIAPLTLTQKLAFIGCVKYYHTLRDSKSHHHRLDALSRLDRGVLEVVLSFASTSFLREFCID